MVSSESAFSSVGWIRRMSLKLEIVEGLVCTKDWEQVDRRKQDQNLEYGKMFDYFINFEINDVTCNP